MEVIRQQNFKLEMYEFSHENSIYRVGLAAYKEGDPGVEVFYPESGSEYMLVVYDKGWYKFELNEFTHKAGIDYIAEKLNCSVSEADVIHDFVASILQSEAAMALLTDSEGWHVRNPFLR